MGVGWGEDQVASLGLHFLPPAARHGHMTSSHQWNLSTHHCRRGGERVCVCPFKLGLCRPGSSPYPLAASPSSKLGLPRMMGSSKVPSNAWVAVVSCPKWVTLVLPCATLQDLRVSQHTIALRFSGTRLPQPLPSLHLRLR